MRAAALPAPWMTEGRYSPTPPVFDSANLPPACGLFGAESGLVVHWASTSNPTSMLILGARQGHLLGQLNGVHVDGVPVDACGVAGEPVWYPSGQRRRRAECLAR